MSFRFADLVGRYRLVVTDALLEFIERAFVEAAPVVDRERVRREALDEAASSELLIAADGTIVSRAGVVEFYRIRVEASDAELEAFDFEKARGAPVTLVLAGSDRLFARQPNKPTAEFHRVG